MDAPHLPHLASGVACEEAGEGDGIWPFALELYRRPGVESAFLRLQDEAGLDVPMLLFCLWAGRFGPGPLPPAAMAGARAIAERWSREVTVPLRAARRALKDPALGAGEARLALRQAVIAAEREAERITLTSLELLGRSLAPGSPGRAAARSNVRLYAGAIGGRFTAELSTLFDALDMAADG